MVTLIFEFNETQDGGVNTHWQRQEIDATEIETKASVAVIGLIQTLMNYGPPRDVKERQNEPDVKTN